MVLNMKELDDWCQAELDKYRDDPSLLDKPREKPEDRLIPLNHCTACRVCGGQLKDVYSQSGNGEWLVYGSPCTVCGAIHEGGRDGFDLQEGYAVGEIKRLRRIPLERSGRMC